MSEEQKKLLEAQLWNIANELRGKMDADEFRDYILGFIFYKYLSEKQYLYANSLLETEAIKDYLNVTDEDDLDAIREESLIKLGYFLKPSELFSYIAKKGNANTETESNFILADLEGILNSIEQSTMGTESEDDFNQLFEDLDLNSTKLGRSTEARNKLIAKVLSHLDKIDFALEDTDADVLGDAYEYLISQFASGAGKKAGEFYTPQQVSKILAQIVTTGKKRLKNVYDPTCGSGSLLLRVAREVEVDEFYGQELNRTTYNLCRMNMILHDVHYRQFDIRQEDVLKAPQHIEKRFEAIVANPPFSAKWEGKNNPLNESDERFSQYGRLAPTSKADFAFLQHMLYQLADNGTMALVLPHGVLFRGSAEGTIRQYIIENLNYLDAVIGLPANIFFGTGIPTSILVLSKCRVNDDNVLFIDASNEFEKDGNKNKLLEEHIHKIVDTYRERKALDKFSYVATIDEIVENDYNLNIPRYVDVFEEEEPLDINNLTDYLNETSNILLELDHNISEYCKKLKIPEPIGVNVNLLEDYKKGVMQQIFSQQLRFKDANGNNYPDWVEKKLKDVGSIVGGGTPSTTNDDFWDGSIQWFTPSEIKQDYVGKSIRTITEVGLKKSSAKLLPKGTILMTTRATIGEVAISLVECTTNQGFQSIITNKSTNNVFLMNWLKLNKHQLMKRANGSTFSEISKSEIEKISIKLPILEEQTQIANFLSAIDKKIELVSTQIEHTQQFKKGLLQQMFV